MIYDIKTKIICSKDVSSDEVTNVLTDVYKVEDVLINERVLSAMGYASPDDLSIDCCFEVVTLSTGIDMAAPGNIDGEVNSGDLDIECSDGSIIRVHQHILANQSMALKRSLKKNKFEIDNAKVLRVSYSSEVVKEMVRFVYTGKINQVTGKEREQMKLANEVWVRFTKNFISFQFLISINSKGSLAIARNSLPIHWTWTMSSKWWSSPNKTRRSRWRPQLLTSLQRNLFELIHWVREVEFDDLSRHFKDVKQTEGWKMISCHPKLMMQLLESI